MITRTAREVERGQTLPIWTFAVLASLALMFFTLNYANVIRAQVRAQTVADMLAQTMLGVQATRWNKLTMALYAADVEEWRIRNLIASMYYAANEVGPCYLAGSCLKIYNDLVPQYDKAVTRYKADAYAIDALAYQPSYHFEGNTEVDGMRATSEIACEHTPVVSSECGQFSYHTINYGYRSTTQAVTKDAFYTHVGGVTGTAPAVNWQPIQIEVSVCETVNPIAAFSVFGPAQPAQIVGRAAATMAPITTEWLAPGVTGNPSNSNGNPLFQEPETYSSADTFGTTPLPSRDWYGTQFPAQPYTAISSDYGMTGSALAADFEVWVPWWGVIPILPYTTTTQNPTMLCTADPEMSN